MDNEIRRFTDEILEDCRNKYHFSRQLVNSNDSYLHEVSDSLVRNINDYSSDYRCIRIDVSLYNSFALLIKEMLIEIFNDPKYDPEDTLVTRDDIVDENREGELEYQLKCILQEDYPLLGIHTLIIFEHFEKSATYWSPGNYGWMRGLLCDVQQLAILITADRKVSEISDEPVGSSPFYNIFEI